MVFKQDTWQTTRARRSQRGLATPVATRLCIERRRRRAANQVELALGEKALCSVTSAAGYIGVGAPLPHWPG